MRNHSALAIVLAVSVLLGGANSAYAQAGAATAQLCGTVMVCDSETGLRFAENRIQSAAVPVRGQVLLLTMRSEFEGVRCEV